MSARSQWSAGRVASLLAGGAALVACTAGSGPLPTPLGTGFEKPGTPFEPSGGQEQPTQPYQPPSGSVLGGGASCAYCGQTFTCTGTADGQTGSYVLTLPPAQGDQCLLTEDGGTAAFSCAGSLTVNGVTTTWTPTSGGGFTFTATSTTTTVTPGGSNGTTVTAVTVTCVPGVTVSGSGSPVSSGGDGG